MRILLAGVAMLALAGCGGGSNAVGANSSESTEITATGNVVANEAAPAPTPTPAAVTDNSGAMGNDTAAAADAPAATDDTASAGDEHPNDDGGDTIRQN